MAAAVPGEPRKTSQHLLPLHHPGERDNYDIYPAFEVGSGKIAHGYDSLAEDLAAHKVIILEGFAGVFWEDVRQQLAHALAQRGKRVQWHEVSRAFKPATEIEAMLEPYLGGDDPVFGKRYPGQLADFFDAALLADIKPVASTDSQIDIDIIYGTGAALAGWQGHLVYVDIPKNEVQFRARASHPSNLATPVLLAAKPAYKRAYFIDWPVLNRHKQTLLPHIDIMVDGQRPNLPVFCHGDTLRAALQAMSESHFRVRPWFEPGAWGGQWIKRHIDQLAQDVPNYAWSFELIVPENGLLLRSDQCLLEVSFDCLMYHAAEAVLGRAYARFETDFPIRFDFLDTVEGGNLSVQCHPRPAYIREHFGEPFTQDETYYILDCTEDASVYLGFQEGVTLEAFREALETSQQRAETMDVEAFVQRHPAARHDLFLIPNGTVHSAGAGNLVLEISATPYIFTFKMYDWLRLDLDGKPRPLNVARACENLYIERQGKRVQQELLVQPRLLQQGNGWQVWHLPTHPEHFYDVVRLEFSDTIEVETHGDCHVMSLVEGEHMRLETQTQQTPFAFAETFVVPAAAGRYRLVNTGSSPAKVIQAFVKSPAADAASYVGCWRVMPTGDTLLGDTPSGDTSA